MCFGTFEHSAFKHLNPVSAGFCYVNADRKRVDCFGESFSLGLRSDVRQDTIEATKQVFGLDALIGVLSENGS